MMTPAGDDAWGHLLVAPLAWLSQGDVFSSVPFIDFLPSGPSGDLSVELTQSAAMLVTHDCALDKKTRAGHSTIEQLSFLPLQSVSALPGERRALVRRNELQPYEAFYLGDVPDVGEAYVLVSDVYAVPAAHFGVSISAFPEPPEGETPGDYLQAGDRDMRVARPTPGQLELLRSKWNAHWTRRLPAVGPTDA